MNTHATHGALSVPEEKAVVENAVGTEEPAKVILFNDEIHTFEEVIAQLIKALKCSNDKAEAIAWEAHSNGRAVAYAGPMPRCIEVSGILEEILLMTQIEV